MANFASFGDWARIMQQRAQSIEADMRAATQEATDTLHAASKSILNTDVYSKPEDTYMYKKDSKGKGYVSVTDALGKKRKRNVQFVGGIPTVDWAEGESVGRGGKKWRRTGNLRRSEKATTLSAYEGAVDNSAAYALARHNLGYGPSSPEAIDPKPTKAKTTERRAPWRTRAIAITAKPRFDIYRRAMWHAITR